MEANQLKITVTDAQGKEISGVTGLVDIQKMYNAHGEGAVKESIYGMFKQLVDRMKSGK